MYLVNSIKNINDKPDKLVILSACTATATAALTEMPSPITPLHFLRTMASLLSLVMRLFMMPSKSLLCTFTISPFFMNKVNDIFCSTLCPAATVSLCLSKTAPAIVFIWRYARSFPRHILGPALNATNLY
ncbi:unnamed protein product [Brassica rapa subsp. narinosa]